MREIKFRAWDESRKSYRTQQNLLDDVCRFHKQDGSSVDVNLFRFLLLVPQQDNFVLEQFTGLKDKNGKDIYGGDIVKYGRAHNGGIYDGPRISAVKYSVAQHLRSSVGWMPFMPFNSGEVYTDSIEIIGNIHENQDLLDIKPKKE